MAQPSLTGTWQNLNAETERQQRQRSIRLATEDVGRLMRGHVRRRLLDRTAPANQIEIAASGNRVELSNGEVSVTLTLGGDAVRVQGPRGSGQAQARQVEGKLVLRVEGDNATRTTTYTLSEDGQRLVLDVRIDVAGLSSPIRFQVTYERR